MLVCSASCWALVAFGKGIMDHGNPVGAVVSMDGEMYALPKGIV